MTGLAAVAELTLVHIVIGVAITTSSWQRILQVSGVAVRAGQVGMTRRKRNTGFTFVVEKHGAPVDDAVATTTVSAEATLMHVIAEVAGATVAVTWLLKISATMTSLTGQAFVSTFQAKTSYQEVLEFDVCP